MLRLKNILTTHNKCLGPRDSAQKDGLTILRPEMGLGVFTINIFVINMVLAVLRSKAQPFSPPWAGRDARRTGSSPSSSASSSPRRMPPPKTGPRKKIKADPPWDDAMVSYTITPLGPEITIPRTLRGRPKRRVPPVDPQDPIFMTIPSHLRDDPDVAHHIMNHYGALPETLLLQELYDQPLDSVYYTGALRPRGAPRPPQHLLDSRQKAYGLRGWGVTDDERREARLMRDSERPEVAQPFGDVYAYPTHRGSPPQTAREATGDIPDSIARAYARHDSSRRGTTYEGIPEAELEVLGNFGKARKRKPTPKSKSKPKAKAKPMSKPKSKSKPKAKAKAKAKPKSKSKPKAKAKLKSKSRKTV